jgi:hypothetical protein
MQKVAIILHAEPGTHDAMGRALHALLYTKELKEAGHEVVLIFDGGGTKWISELIKEDNPLAPLYKAVKETGAISGVCEYCVGAFGGETKVIEESGLSLASEYMGHPSVAALFAGGFQVITL